jgi:hypothetical protein
MVGRGILVVGAALLLTGCVAHTSPPAAGLTDEEESLYSIVTAPSAGSNVLESDIEPVEYVPPAGWGTAVGGCMNAAGFPDYVGDGPNLRLPTGDAGVSYEQSLAFYVCLAKYPVAADYSSYINLEQLGYLYDYFRDSLIPCLGAAGYSMTGDVPTREEFVVITKEPHWHPYDALSDAALNDVLLRQNCPASPFAENLRF